MFYYFNMYKFLPLLLTIITIFGNYLIPRLVNNSLSFVPEEYKLDVQPIGWTFSIWSIIYLTLLFLTYQISQGVISWNNYSLILFTLSCIFNLSWLYFWGKKRADISQYLLIGIVLTVGLLWKENIGISQAGIYQNSLIIYFAWTLGASLINFYIVNGKNNIKSSKTILYLLSFVQLFWQIFTNDITALNESILFPVTGIWTGLGILSNKSNNLGKQKVLPLVVSIICFLIHYSRIGNPNILKLLF